ncbi:TPA: hypothetical protein ACXDAY_002171 [Clostridium botulinum]|uniref:hypothetical protein n=1 Tax=Clostridium botulinum TaxID=1491 RepID=UPI000465DF9F|nr:hypothetical protein [Clostridium botulinum]APH20903.1 hypothetical protein NPD1_4198 [Clostridium botulinum]APQ71265.1 hypothetical protein RSJ8_4155 [Clostridium botulinum]APR02352.1 hypothetical protein RSJ2_4018 [Clostridium botulinum]AUN01542.1 hypothetical protein RSJ19_00740 [Clostridium botulinum]MBN3359259.1 hypothetical protein [Clostridium botulinum]
MENQLQEVKNQFTKDLFERIYQEIIRNGNEDLFSYYNLIIANLDKHDDIFKDILENGLAYITYVNEDMGYTDGDIIVYLNNKTEYNIKLIWKENMIGDCYENEECVLTHEYTITHIVEKQTITEENTDVNMLHKIKIETENKLKKFRLQQKLEKLNQMLEERNKLELDIEELQNELALAS